MDQSTHQHGQNNARIQPVRTGLDLLITNLAAGRLAILTPESTGSAAKGKAMNVPTGYALAAHDFPELVQKIEGDAVLRLKRGVRRLDTNKPCLIMPGTLHAESRAHAGGSYRLLWGMAGPSGAHYLVSAVGVTGGQLVAQERHWLEHSAAARFWAAATAKDAGMTPRDQARLQGLLLVASVEALEGLEQPATLDFHQHLVRQIRQHLERNYERPISIASLAGMVRCTPNHLNSIFRKEVGAPIHQYLLNVRLTHAEKLLATGRHQIKEIAYRTGFSDPLYFSRAFRARYGHPPTRHNNHK